MSLYTKTGSIYCNWKGKSKQLLVGLKINDNIFKHLF